MRIKTNYHTHLALCNHAVGEAKDYVLEAVRLGYEELGISDHAPVCKDWFSDFDYHRLYGHKNMNMDQFYNDYLIQLKNINTKELSFKKGIETEYIEGHDEYYRGLLKHLDYMILGVHFYKVGDKYVDTYVEMTKEYMYAYARNVENALSTGMFKILAHPDLYLVGLDYFDEDCKKVANMIIDSCIKYGVYLEINCNSKTKKYPDYNFFKEVVGKPVKLIVGVDAHDPLRLSGDHIDYVYDLIDNLGLEVKERIEF